MVLSAGSLQTLVLCHCKLESSIRYNVKLPFLRKLHLLHFVVDDDVINDLVTKSPLIEDICICICEYKSIKFSCPNLKSLLIKNCPSLDEVNIKTPQLSEFSYYDKIITVHLNGLALTRCTFDFWNPKDSNPNFQAIWLKFHGSFPNDYEVLEIFNNVETAIVSQEWRRNLPSPFHGVEHLNFTIQTECEKTSVLEVLDGLLWISPHAETISIRFRSSFRTFKFSYKNQLNNGRQTPWCCKSRPVSCWQCCIENVEFEIGIRAGDEVRIKKSYIFEDEDIWGRISNLADLDFE